MNRLIICLISLLLAPCWVADATARDFVRDTQGMSRKADKIMIMLDYAGLADPQVAKFVQAVDARVDNGYLKIAEDHIAGGTLQLRYDIDGISADRLQLHYRPDNSRVEYIARPDGVMVHYQLKF